MHRLDASQLDASDIGKVKDAAVAGGLSRPARTSPRSAIRPTARRRPERSP